MTQPEKRLYAVPYDPTFRPRMGLALRAVERALNSQAKWRSVLSEVKPQQDVCAASLALAQKLVISAQSELREASKLLQTLGSSEIVRGKAERSAFNVAVHRESKAREALSKAEKQAKGAADRLAITERKVARAVDALHRWGQDLPALIEAALPFASWVTTDRNPAFTSYLAEHGNHEPQ